MDDRILQLALELRELAQEGLFEGNDARYKRIPGRKREKVLLYCLRILL